MTTDHQDMFALDLQLSEQETGLIGLIVAHWAALEHHVFSQTLASFEGPSDRLTDLPKEMNNIQFTQVLKLWKERVVDGAPHEISGVLQRIHDAILEMKEPRDALVHGMWHWSASAPHVISSVRVRKREVITSHFNLAYLQDMATRLAKLNFQLLYPGGLEDLATARQKVGAYVSRKGLELMSRSTGTRQDSGKKL